VKQGRAKLEKLKKEKTHATAIFPYILQFVGFGGIIANTPSQKRFTKDDVSEAFKTAQLTPDQCVVVVPDLNSPVTKKCNSGRDRCGCVVVAEMFGAESVA
jgi:hypothetical protein